MNIVQNKTGYDVVNNSIVNAFNNPERSIVLDCVTVRGHENAVWEVPENFDQSQYTITSHSVYLSTITIIDPGMDIVVSLKCMSDTSKEYRTVTVRTGIVDASKHLLYKCNKEIFIFSRKPIFEAIQ